MITPEATVDAQKHPVEVFISYASEDARIADTVRTELMAFGRNEINVFQDCIDIHAGEDWQDVIETQIRISNWLICIFTGKVRDAFSFPGFEVGLFKASHGEDADSRIVCLHDTDRAPDIFEDRQNVS